MFSSIAMCCETETYLHHGLFQHYITMWDNTLRKQYRDTANKENADGAVGIFGKCRARVGFGPAPGPTKKALCHTCPLGGARNKYRSIVIP